MPTAATSRGAGIRHLDISANALRCADVIKSTVCVCVCTYVRPSVDALGQ